MRRTLLLGVYATDRVRPRGSSLVTFPSTSAATCAALAALLLTNQCVSQCDSAPALVGPDHAIDRALVNQLRDRLHDLLETSDEARWLDDGDFTLHRFLVSRGNKIEAAEEMFRSTVAWRSKHNVRSELELWRVNSSGRSQDLESGEQQLGRSHGYAARAGFTEDGAPLNIER